MEDQTQSNDAILDATKAELELTTNIKNLIVKCNPNLKADVKTSVSKADATVNIISVVFPIAELQAAKKEMSEAQSEYDRLTALIEEDKTTDKRDNRDKSPCNQQLYCFHSPCRQGCNFQN